MTMTKSKSMARKSGATARPGNSANSRRRKPSASRRVLRTHSRSPQRRRISGWLAVAIALEKSNVSLFKRIAEIEKQIAGIHDWVLGVSA